LAHPWLRAASASASRHLTAAAAIFKVRGRRGGTV